MSKHSLQSDPTGDGSPEGRKRPVSQYLETPSLTQKSRRVGERVIEGSIYVIAATSIISIFLIFFFVFREASPIILGGDAPKHESVAEQYLLPEVGAPATGTPPAGDSAQPDVVVYNGATDSIPLAGNKPDTAAGASADSGSSADGEGIIVYNQGTDDIPLAQRDTTVEADSAAIAIDDAQQAGMNDLKEQIEADGYPVLTHDSAVKLSYLWHNNWQPNSEHPRYGILPIIAGTFKTTFFALLFAAPLAILAALYTAFFAPKRIRETIKPVIEILAGFPSVVLGFFCLMTVASIVQAITGAEFRLNAIVGGIGLGLAVIPIIYTITEDALRAVPQSLREAALALGATEWEAAYKVMLPAATPGIFAAVLLGLGRAFGETMIALMATGNAGTYSWNFFEPVRTFAATIGAEMGEVVFGSPHYRMLFLLGVILFVFSFLINLVTEFYVKDRLIKKFRGAE